MKKKIMVSALLVIVLMMSLCVTVFAAGYSVAAGGLQTSLVEMDTHTYSSKYPTQKYKVTVSSSLNYSTSRAWNASSNIYASYSIRAGEKLLFSSAVDKMIRYKGFATTTNVSWNARGTYEVYDYQP